MLSNTHFSIAVHVLTALAYFEKNDRKTVGSDELARTVHTNPSFLRGLIGRLKEAELVETVLGKGGGTRLARPPLEITLHDVYRATESKPALKTHNCDDQADCPIAAGMGSVLLNINNRIELAVASELGQLTVSDLLAGFIGSES